MIKSFLFPVLVVAMALPAYGSSFPVTFKDVAGRTITIKEEPKTFALSSARVFPALDIILGIHAADKLIAWRNDMQNNAPSMYAYYAERFPKIKALPELKMIRGGSFNTESFLKARPDIFFMDLYNLEAAQEINLLQTFEKDGITTVVIDFRDHPVQNTRMSVLAIGKSLGHEEEARAYLAYYDRHLKALQDGIPNTKPRVFLERAAGDSGIDRCCYTFSHSNMGEFVNFLGGENIANKYFKAASGTLSVETVLSENPDVYVMVSTAWEPLDIRQGIALGYFKTIQDIRPTTERILKRSWMSYLEAYKNKRIYAVYMPFYNSPMNIVAYEYLAKWMYPESFKALNPDATFTEIYKTFAHADVRGILGLNVQTLSQD